MAVDIEDLALVGDLHTAAIVTRGGSVVWMCVPQFDSDSCFASLVGDPQNGHWTMRPVQEPEQLSRRYRGDTLILETTFRCKGGSARVIDFMPRRDEYPTLIRIVEGIDGSVEFTSELVCRFGYGDLPPWTRVIGDATTMTVGGNGMALRTPALTSIEGRDVMAKFAVSAGERVPFTLQWYPSNFDPPEACDPYAKLQETEDGWNDWSQRCEYNGPYREAVMRSLITLKALTYEPTGGCIAAVTTSLPEELGGKKNWDYRYAWIRDSAFTVDALVEVGYHEEALAWRDWLLRMLAGDPSKLQIAYSVTGDRHLQEWEADWLDGYEGSTPVRIGNAAYKQFQLGVYGEMLDAIETAHEAGIDIDEHAWEMLQLVLDYVEGHWNQPDSGIWESRGKDKHYTNSRVMAWVAFDRAIRIMERDKRQGPIERYRALRDRIAEDVCEHGYKAKRKAFVQSYESDSNLDASVLLIPLMGFLPMDDERVMNTLHTLEEELLVDGYLMRQSQDIKRRLGRTYLQEGAFIACNAWLVQNYVLAGRLDDATSLFERLLRIRSDVGLLSEEYDQRKQRLVGNMPQTFSHATLVNAALKITEAQG